MSGVDYADLKQALDSALAFIEQLGDDLQNRRVADWYPEGANNAALAMSEDMRLLGNACADFVPTVSPLPKEETQ